jgi:hypothetical protein
MKNDIVFANQSKIYKRKTPLANIAKHQDSFARDITPYALDQRQDVRTFWRDNAYCITSGCLNSLISYSGTNAEDTCGGFEFDSYDPSTPLPFLPTPTPGSTPTPSIP